MSLYVCTSRYPRGIRVKITIKITIYRRSIKKNIETPTTSKILDDGSRFLVLKT